MYYPLKFTSRLVIEQTLDFVQSLSRLGCSLASPYVTTYLLYLPTTTHPSTSHRQGVSFSDSLSSVSLFPRSSHARISFISFCPVPRLFFFFFPRGIRFPSFFLSLFVCWAYLDLDWAYYIPLHYIILISLG